MMDDLNAPESNVLVHNRMLAAEIKRRVNQLSAINTVAAVVSQSLDLSSTLEKALDAVLSVIGVEASGISLIDEEAGELILRAQRGWKQDFVTSPMRIKLGHGLSGLVIAKDEVMITGDVSKDERLVVPAVAEENIQAMAMAPMHARGKVIGVISVISYQPYKFSPDEIEVLCAIADQVGVALDNARLYETAREQQNRLMAVLQSTADAIIVADDVTRIAMVNSAAARLFNIDEDLLLGCPLAKSTLPVELRERLLQTLADMPSDTARMFDIMLGSAIGPISAPLAADNLFLSVIVSSVTAPSPFTDRQFNGYVIVFQNVTHIKQAERARLQFIQTAAHDLRNPLGVTLSALTMLNRGWKDPTATEREVFDIAMRGLHRMQDLIDDLLHLEKLESGQDFHPEWCDLAEVMVGCARDITPTLARNEQHLTIDIAPDLPRVYLDPRWIVRALANLLNNAHKYTPDDSTITLRAYTEQAAGSNTTLTIEVSDNGPGIPVESQPHLFERFYRVPSVEKAVPGTGLGLAIVKSVAELHGGQISVESESGRGSCFRMSLPLALPVIVN